MGDVIDFVRELKRRDIYIENFKVRTKEDLEFLLANQDRILVTLPDYDDNVKSGV